jgi:hypothetical protein
MWNYRTTAQEPVQDLGMVDCNGWDPKNKNNESESTYTHTTVRVLGYSSKLLEIPSGPKASTNVITAHLIFSSLEEYLSNQQQHERLLLGLGRRPLNAVIGAKRRRVESPRYYHKKSDIHSRESSSDSLSSYHSCSIIGGYDGSLYSKTWDVPKERRYRTPDSGNAYSSCPLFEL